MLGNYNISASLITLGVKMSENSVRKTKYSFTSDLIKGNFSKSIGFRSLKVLDLL